MRRAAHPTPDDIDITALWSVVRRGLPRLLMYCFAAGVVTYAVLMMVAPRYVAEAQLAIVGKGTANPYADPTRGATQAESVTVRMDKEAINTHVRALLSPDLAARIATDMKLGDRVEFNRALGSPDTLSALLRVVGIGGPRAGESEQDGVLAAYFSRLEVYSPKESRSISVRFASMDPELAAAVANRIAETYRSSLATQSVDETDAVQKALEPKIARLTEEVAAAEAETERFRGQANIFKGSQQSANLNDQQLGELAAELSRVKAARSDAEARTASAREMTKAGSADALPDVQKSPLIQNLVQQRVRAQRQVSELSATLLPGHPRMRQLNADLAGLKKQIQDEVAKVVSSLEKEAKVMALREESITRSLNDLKARIVTAGPNEVRLRSLEAAAKSKRAELERLQSQYESNRVRADSRAVPVEAEIVTTARPSSIPVFPKKGSYALLVMAGVFLFGLALNVTRALLAGVRQAEEFDIELPRFTGDIRKTPVLADEPEPVEIPEPVLAEVPEKPEPEGVRVKNVTTVAGMAARLDMLKESAANGVRTLIAGEFDAVDFGADALELARALSLKGRTVLVADWCPVGDGIAPGLGISAKPGMTELLEGTAKFEDVVTCIGHSDVQFIAAGKTRAPSLGGPDPDRVNVILDALDEVYDHIIVIGQRPAARALFEAIEGRFDAGITVADAKRHLSVVDGSPNSFLGFEVDAMELMVFERQEARPNAGDRLLRVAGAKAQAMHA